ncbi:response regulator [Paenibacillus sp. FSL M8-0142]|uniref:response regulator transcription factor n=1 Tax=Paenibacillus sp. FSL M8-0142 TaxID=2954525 RepID=UPI00315AEE5D
MYKLMIIDDEYAIHLSLRKLTEMSGLGIEVVAEAEDGAEALKLMEETSPDIIVTDICMPEMDGLEFIRRVRESRKHTFILILSGHDNFEYARQAMRCGVSDFLLKPVDPAQFHAALVKACEELDRRVERFSRQTAWTLAQQRSKAQLVDLLWSAQEREALALAGDMIAHFETGGPADVSLPRYVRMLMQELLLMLEERGLKLPDGELRNGMHTPDIAQDDDKEACRQRLLKIISETICWIKGMRNLGAHHNIVKAKRYIEENYAAEDLSLQEVADSLGMSVTYLSRTFKNETNMNFVKYVTQVRMEKAKELLAQGGLSAQEAAYRVGYSDYVHFSKTFKKVHGLTPSEFRKQSKTMTQGPAR